MAELTRRPLNEGFLLSEANGFRSRETVTLKAGSAYQAGSVLIAEYVEAVADSGNFNTATGKHILATAALVVAYSTVSAAVLCRYTDATDGAVDAAVIARDAEVKDTELVFGADTDVDDLRAALEAKGIAVRAAI